jgi:glutamate 5-kinase
MQEKVHRANLPEARRIVVKVGTRSLVQRSGRPDPRRMAALVDQLAELRQGGRDVVLVTSGAIGAGVQALGLPRRPTELNLLQMSAAVGQSRLMARYADLFGRRGIIAGQVLLTHDDLRSRGRHLSARSTLMAMLAHGVVPIVNENDTVAVDEIKFGDNDHLAALVALLVDADALALVTTVDGLRAPAGAGRTRRVPHVDGVTGEVLGLARGKGKGSELSTGGMLSKLQSAKMAVTGGIPVLIVDGSRPGSLLRAFAGADEGTYVAPGRGLRALKRWLAFFERPAGAVVVDGGARAALVEQGRSLLPIGVRAVEGDFAAGAVVEVKDAAGMVVARGQTAFSSEDLRRVGGRRSDEVAALLGRGAKEVIHRDNLAVLEA